MTNLRRRIALIALLAALLLAGAGLRQTARLSELPIIPLPRARPALLEEIPANPKPGPHVQALLADELPAQPKPGAQAIDLLTEEVAVPHPHVQQVAMLDEEWPSLPKP